MLRTAGATKLKTNRHDHKEPICFLNECLDLKLPDMFNPMMPAAMCTEALGRGKAVKA